MMKPFTRLFYHWASVLLFAPVLLGCGLSLCDVSGLVSIDGKPAPAGLKITFAPRDGTSEPILGVTENDGRYRLIHRSGRPGVPAGTYTVSLGFWGDASVNPPGLSSLTLPEEFLEGTSTLVCDVRSGRTEFNIEVKKQ